MTSGEWELLRQIPPDDPRLSVLAKEAHAKAGMGDDVKILDAVKEERWLDFYDPANFTSIMIDVLVYSVQGHVKNDTRIPYFYYITKGLEPDCVYHLSKEKLTASRLFLDKQACGLVMPTASSR